MSIVPCAAVEVSNLPPGVTYDELQAVMGAQAAALSLAGGGAQLSALVLLESPESAAACQELFDGSDWGGRTLRVVPADAAAWLGEHCAEFGGMPAGLLPAAAAAAHGAAQPPTAAAFDHPAVAFDQERAPGFELPDWDWAQQHGEQQQQQQQYGDWGADAYWPEEEAAAQQAEDEWQAVELKPRGGGRRSGGGGAEPGEPAVQLSRTRIMVRNLHPDTAQHAVEDAFKRFGRLVHCIKHPAKQFAHIEFADAAAAAAALRQMHEQEVPALNPDGIIYVQPSLPHGMSAPRTAPRAAAPAPPRPPPPAARPRSDAEKHISQHATPCLWVGNIAAKATADDLRAVFGRFGPLLQCQLGTSQAALPRGIQFGIVQYRSKASAEAAFAALNRQVEPPLGAHPLKMSAHSLQTAVEATMEASGRPAPGLVFDLADAGSGALVLTQLQRHQAAGGHAQRHAPGAATPVTPSALPHPHPHPPAPLAPRRLQQQQQLAAGTAGQLNAQLQALEAPSGALRSAVLGEDAGEAAPSCSGRDAAQPRRLGRRLAGAALRVGDMLQPQGEAPGDATWHERTANVLTSLPFSLLGWHMYRQRLTPEGRQHALSLVAVGAAATLYHATSGAARRAARKLDYWVIGVSSALMTKTLFADSPATCRAANLSLAAVPFRPFAVSLGHAGAMQAEFARQAAHSEAVRRDLKRHYAAAALGMGAFFAEDLVMDSGWGGFVHAAWHCLACYGVHTMNPLLAHKERQRLAAQLRPSLDGGKPLRRPVHSSASSLPSYSGGKLGGWSPGVASP